MERHFRTIFGKQLRKEYAARDDLPQPMQRALEKLLRIPYENDLPKTRGGNRQDPISINVQVIE